MQSEREVPPVPGLARLTWMLFMQPIKLHGLYQAWGLEKDHPLLRLWSRIRAKDLIVRTLLRRYALLLFIAAPLITIVLAGLLHLVGFHVNPLGVALGVALGTAFGVASGVALSAVFGVIFGVIFGVAVGVVCGVTEGAGVVVGCAVAGAAGGVALAIALDLANGLANGVALPVGVLLGLTFGVAVGVAVGAKEGVLVGTAPIILLLRLPLYPFEAACSLLLSTLVRIRPQHARQLAGWLPYRHHDVIYQPLPGLRSFIVQVGRQDPEFGMELITETAETTSQRTIGMLALLDLQCWTLTNAAQERSFVQVANLDSPFLSGGEPVLPIFQRAAQDLCVDVDGEDHRRRRFALERARKTIHGYVAENLHPDVNEIDDRNFLPVAKLWLDVVADEQAKLSRAEKENPQVPRSFFPGLPLDPDRPEQRVLFKGRTDLGRIVNHHLDADRQGVLVIVGQRRMGKSSFRNFLPRLLGTSAEIVAADFQMLSGHEHRSTPHRWILDLVAKHLPKAPSPPDTSAWSAALEWLSQREVELKTNRMLIVIDEVERVEDGIRAGWCSTDFLDFLRACGDKLRRIRFVLLTAYRLPRLGRHWNDRLISATSRNISYLDRKSAEELLRKPIEDFPDIYPDGGVDHILDATHGQPFLVQKVGDELCEHLNAQKRFKATNDDLTEVLDRVARENVFEELWDYATPEERVALHQLACTKEPLEANATMRSLVEDGYVELNADEKATIAVPLYGAWIRRSQGRIPPTQAST